MTADAAPQAPDVSTQPLLLYNAFCPYVQRVTLALGHKHVAMPQLDIDLQNKPTWLTKFSPLGKVPAVTYLESGKQQVLYESLPLVFWVDEYFKEGPALLPESPAQRTLARIAIARFDSGFIPAWFQALRAQNVEDFKGLLTKLHTELSWLEDSTALAEGGPFLTGSSPGLVDAVVSPWMLRCQILKLSKNVDVLAKHPKLTAWLEKYKALPEVLATFRGKSFEEWTHEYVGAFSKAYKIETVDFSSADA